MNKLTLSLSVVVLAGSLQWASAGDITGKVTLKGTPPPEITIPYDDTCSKLHPAIPTTRRYVVGKDNGLANVFVYISKGLEGKKFTAPTEVVELDQIGCNYNPYVFGVMVGQPVRIKNSDPLMHNIHALPTADGNTEFNFAETAQGDVNDTKWTDSIKAPEVMVKLKCDVHNWMYAYAGVQAHPFFAVTDADGNFKIANVPAGSYTLTAYHLKVHGINPGAAQDITVADSPVTANFTVEVPPPQ
jgi:plastocyanin